jgi:3-deoxy-D-manno-octulosonate 8-phosphate phosphatase (KDO 8-P phosphatase)
VSAPSGSARARVSRALLERARRVELLALDVDGVLTDGRLYYGPSGEELKVFHSRDGLGLRMLASVGVEVALITARSSAALNVRAQQLGVRHFKAGRDDKWVALTEILADRGLASEQVAFVGDDVLDLPVLRKVGLAITVADAHPLVRAEAHWSTTAPGGRGAVREVTDLLLESRQGLAAATEAFLAHELGKGSLGTA